MDKILCTCPTRGRPERLKQMLKSFHETAGRFTDVMVWLDEDDPKLNEYDLSEVNYVIKPRIHVAQMHNAMVIDNPGYDYYMPINDDIIFHTVSWDSKLIAAIQEKGEGWGISFGDDLTNNNAYSLPTFGMVSANIVKTLGYVYPLELKALFGDTFLLDVGRAIGKLFYCPDVVIQHKPPEKYCDDDVRLTETFDKQERKAYAQYIDTKLDKDIGKLFEAIIKDKSLQGANR